jgi:hypothetical protein
MADHVEVKGDGGTGARFGIIIIVFAGIAALAATLLTFV